MYKATFEKDVAMTILSQIEAGYGGTINIDGKSSKISALKLMGAKDFVYGSDFVQFVVQGKVDFNKVKVILNAKDLYDVELWNVRVGSAPPYVVCDKVDEFNDLYAEQLGNLLVREVTY